MFKTDKKSLEALSFDLNERDLANFKAIIEHLQRIGLLTLSQEEIKRALNGLNEIGRLKLDGKIYAFSTYDSIAEREQGRGEGVQLFLRQGDELRHFYSPATRDYTFSASDIIDFLEAKRISTVYTGSIPTEGFLGILPNMDDEDPLTLKELTDANEYLFKSYDITVIRLDSLI